MSKLDDLIAKLCPDGVEFKTFGEISIRIKGMTGVSKKWGKFGNCKFIDYLNVYNHIKVDTSLIKNATVKNQKQDSLQIGDILITSASETFNECAITAIIENNIEKNVFLDDHLFGIRIKEEWKDKINPSYINYYFYSKSFKKVLPKAIRGVTRYYISLPDFMRLSVPLPPLEIQQEIVRILDNFTELTEELTARKKQYEYYRDKLLTFKEAKKE